MKMKVKMKDEMDAVFVVRSRKVFVVRSRKEVAARLPDCCLREC